MLTDSLDVDLVSSAERDEVASDAGMLNFPPAVEIEDVSGGVLRDIIRGNDLPNRFLGRGGNDELGGSGVDTVYGDSPDASTPAGDDTIDVADGGDTVDRGPNATLLSGDKVEVGAEQDLSTGEITRVDTATNCETVKEVLIN